MSPASPAGPILAVAGSRSWAAKPLILAAGTCRPAALTSSAALNVTGGGSLVTSSGAGAIIGTNAVSGGTVNVGGTGSSWNNSSSGVDIGQGGTGTLNITGGGSVTQHGAVTIGDQTGTSGSVTVDGETGPATLSATADITVGYDGTGTLGITRGGSVSNANAYIGANTGHGTATIGGGGGSGDATWTNSQQLYVGYKGTGTLNVTGGGSVSSSYAFIGDGGIGTVTVGGGNGSSNWTSSGSLIVGENGGTGTLEITGGGSVSTASHANVGGFLGNGTATVGGGTGMRHLDHQRSVRGR